MNNKLTSILLIGLFFLTGCGLMENTPPTPTAPAPAPLVFPDPARRSARCDSYGNNPAAGGCKCLC